MRRWIPGLALAFGASLSAQDLQTIEERTTGMQHLAGYFDLYYEESTGKLFWEIERFNEEFLYQISLTTGLGSNPVGLDRGQLGNTHILRAELVGPRVMLVEPNYSYRATTSNPDERRAVTEAFAPSIHWGFSIEARTGDRVLVDATDFFLRDAHGVAETLGDANQGRFSLERSRSAIYQPRTRSYPRNTEVETMLTFTSSDPGQLVNSTAAWGGAVTVRQHHSLVELPPSGFRTRRADPRAGFWGIQFSDYGTPIDQPLSVRWAARHRLEKRNPRAARSEPVRPIVYYLDRGTPEPIRTALLEGARWWNEAFEAAGFIDAFRVELLPEGADPMDIRYNMIHWTHRSTRGWSYGTTVTDPRTGEIIRGVVNLGSLRLKQDFLLANGLDPMFGSCEFCDAPGFDYLPAVAAGDGVEMALARVRQLSAHEIGHTLGIVHNYIASTEGRASVMDYPAPLVIITPDGQLSLDSAYDAGIGEWDKLAIRWGYTQFPDGTDEAAALEQIIQDGLRQGLRFLTDQDARPEGGAHPLAALWDNGSDPIQMLRHEIRVREIGLGTFSERVLRPGEPLAALEEVLVPLYLHHRYQVEAAIKSVGGVDYNFALRGDGQTPYTIVPGARQRAALSAVLETIRPRFLALPRPILGLIPPRAFFMGSGETFQGNTGATLDPHAMAESAARLPVSQLLHPERMARLEDFHARNPDFPGLSEVVDSILGATWLAPPESDAYLRQAQIAANRAVLDVLLGQAAGRHPASVRAVLGEAIERLETRLAANPDPLSQQAARDIHRWQERAHDPDDAPRPRELPPGSPIGN